jgi:tryptophan synthase alpha chain
VILHANQKALASGATVQKCFNFAHSVARTFDIPFLFMTYYNILFQYGVERFAEEMARAGFKGAIVPDLPPEEGMEYLKSMDRYKLSPILIISPTTPFERMKYLASLGRGFIYCMARKGVTGAQTDFSAQLGQYLAQCYQATKLPLALGFGVKEKEDIDYLIGKADIAVIGSETLRIVDKEGIDAVGAFIKSLRCE